MLIRLTYLTMLLVVLGCDDDPVMVDSGPETESNATVVKENPVLLKSVDEQFRLQLVARSFTDEASVTVELLDSSFADADAVSEAYHVITEAKLSGSFAGTVSIDLDGAKVDALSDSELNNTLQLRLARGDDPEKMWDELIVGNYDRDSNTYTAPVDALGYFVVVLPGSGDTGESETKDGGSSEEVPSEGDG